MYLCSKSLHLGRRKLLALPSRYIISVEYGLKVFNYHLFIHTPLLIDIINSKNLTDPTCPSGYDNVWSDSTHCYRIVNEQVTWEAAKVKCRNEGGELACFSDQQERDAVTDKCDNCWVGYTWQNGRSIQY